MQDFSLTSSGNLATMSKALPGEPAFIILGRDPDGAFIVRLWADRRHEAGDPDHADQVYAIANAMAEWAENNRPVTAPRAAAYENPDGLIKRLRKDIDEIRRNQDRTGPKGNRPMRWEGTPPNPNGWRLFGDLANDLEKLLDALPQTTSVEKQGS